MNTFMNMQGISINDAAFKFQFAHDILGLVLILVGLSALLAYQYPNKPKLGFLWPWVDLIGSLLLLLYITVMFWFR